MATRFRYVKSSRLRYKRQGLVWFQCQNYKRLSKREQENIGGPELLDEEAWGIG